MRTTLAAISVAVLVGTAGGTAHAAECNADLVSAGEKGFRACAACHKVEDGKNGVGPHLSGLIGRDIASVDGFKYSKGMQAYAEANGAWTEELFDAYIEAPRKVVKGTRMAYPGQRKAEKRQELLCYLTSVE